MCLFTPVRINFAHDWSIAKKRDELKSPMPPLCHRSSDNFANKLSIFFILFTLLIAKAYINYKILQ